MWSEVDAWQSLLAVHQAPISVDGSGAVHLWAVPELPGVAEATPAFTPRWAVNSRDLSLAG